MLSNDDGLFGPRCDVMMLIGGGGRLGDRVDVLVDGLVAGLVILLCWPLTFNADLDSSPLMTV